MLLRKHISGIQLSAVLKKCAEIKFVFVSHLSSNQLHLIILKVSPLLEVFTFLRINSIATATLVSFCWGFIIFNFAYSGDFCFVQDCTSLMFVWAHTFYC